jgi:hypothetical protein
MIDIKKITDKFIEFRNDRDWEQFHNPKDFALTINIESSALLEEYLWEKIEETNKEQLAAVLAS